MRNHKYRLENLAFYDYRGVEEHLSQMAARGWELEKASSQLWKYRRIEPAQIRYAVTYSPDASPFNPGPTEGQQSLEELCAAAGWAKICDWQKMQIFSSRAENPVPLETDDGLRLENIHRVMKKNLLWGNLIMLALGLVGTVRILHTLFQSPLRVLEYNGQLFSGCISAFLVLLELGSIAQYFLWRRRSLQSIAAGGGCAPLGQGYHIANRLAWAVLTLLVAAYLLAELTSGNQGATRLFLVYMSLFVVVIFLGRKTSEVLRRFKASRGTNIAGTLAVNIVLSFALVGCLSYAAIHFDWFRQETGETYVYLNREWDVHPTAGAPLTLSGLTGDSYAHICREWNREGSLLLPKWSYLEWVLPEGSDAPLALSYAIWETDSPKIRQAIINNFRGKSESLFPAYFIGRPDVPANWGVDEVYRRYFISEGESPETTFLLCGPGRIVQLYLEWEPSAAEQAAITRALFPAQ